tara:strand:+ start:445 stop:804 length:360 start_codon:yes stop_codon:yes gene_type:complete
MFYDITIWILISLILIILLHYLFNFFKDTLTVPKVKDLIVQPQEKYKNIEIITNQSNKEEGTTSINDLKQSSTEPITNDVNDMKNELKNFFNDLKLQNNNISSNNLDNNLAEKLYSEIR